jgi:hypothetical protein
VPGFGVNCGFPAPGARFIKNSTNVKNDTEHFNVALSLAFYEHLINFNL